MTKYVYRIDQNDGQLPEEGKPVVQAVDPVEARSVFTLSVKHVLACDESGVVRRGFMPSVKVDCLPPEDGDVCFGDNGVACGMAIGKGFLMIERKMNELNGLAVAVT